MTEPDVSSLISVADAIAIIDSTRVQPRTARVSLSRCGGLYLAHDIVADRDLPPWDKCLMDGFALRAGSAGIRPGTQLTIIGELAAGAMAAGAVADGQAMAVMTGAPVPPGADCIIPVEMTRRHSGAASPDIVELLAPATAGAFISRRGADTRIGTIVLPRGARLGSGQIAAAASVGADPIDVCAPPAVAMLSTGDEIVQADQTPTGAQIRDANSPMIAELLKRFGCDVRPPRHVRDDPALLREAIIAGLESDILFISGGMSMGSRDFVPQILLDLGIDLKITKLRIKPGKPFIFGVGPPRSGRNPPIVFGLPGNPVSGFVCTVRLASRLLIRLSGGQAPTHLRQARLAAALPANGPREFYQPASLEPDGVRPLQWKGSADVFTLAAAGALLVRPENQPALAAGVMVEIIEL
jgi:molybdopterin molybdotransferase